MKLRWGFSKKSKKKIRLIRQRDAMQCGIASLCMICKYWGVDCSIEELEEFCFVTKEGISLKGIAEAAHSLGFTTEAIRITTSKLISVQTPCILHWDQNHFVVLYKIDRLGTRFWIADPAKGKFHISLEQFEKHWASTKLNSEPAGVAMIFNKTDNQNIHLKGQLKSKSGQAILLRSFRSYRKHLAVVCLALLLTSLLQLILPFLTQLVVDVGIHHKDLGFIWLILIGELMIVTGRTVTDFIRRWLMLHISMRINISLVSDFFIKLLKLPMSFFDTKLMGDLLQRIGDHGRVRSFLTEELLNLIFSSLSFVVLGVVLAFYNPLIFVVFMACTILYVGWISIFLGERRTLDFDLFQQEAKNQSRTYQFVTSMQEIKLQGCEERRRQEWEETQADLFVVQMKSLKLRQMQEGGSIFLNEMKNILVTVLAATAVINGEMSLGAMLAVQYIIGQLNSPVDQLMGFINSFQDVKLSLERISEVHDSQNEEYKESMTKSFLAEKSISLKAVSFKYDRHSLINTVEDISFEIPDGKMTAIVGDSGSGKTTLIRLMLGYYPVLSGSITIAGHRIDEYSMKWWRSRCGVVMQDGVIFSESIARNIAIGDAPIDVERLEEAARIANIHDFITYLPLKYDTKIGRDGVGLSQGQKQRILIARAVYKNPDFIFLDEATNALDAKNERIIVENLARFYKGRTVVVVAHRLSTVKDADQIIVLNRGKVMETGNHNSLIKEYGWYYHLVKNQLELGT